MLYELAADPLGDSADPRRYVPVESHERALDALAGGIRAGRSPLLLKGGGGVGKTLLLRVLAQRERRRGRVAVFSPFLHLAPDDVARWLLYLLGGEPSAEPVSDATLLDIVRLYRTPSMVVIVDEIQSAPPSSVERLTTLVRAAGANLSLVVAGAPGSQLDRLLPLLEPKTTYTLPDELTPDELDTLYNAILSHPALERDLRRLARHDHDSLVHAAHGIPALLRNELVRRAAYVTVGASIPAFDGEPEPLRLADLWRGPESEDASSDELASESEPGWPAWPGEHELELRLRRAPTPGLAPWPQRPLVNEVDLARWSPAPAAGEAPPTPVSALEPARTGTARWVERAAAAAATLATTTRQWTASWEPAARDVRRLALAVLRQAHALVRDLGSELDTSLRRQLQRSRARARWVSTGENPAAAPRAWLWLSSALGPLTAAASRSAAATVARCREGAGAARAALAAATRERLAGWELALRDPRRRAIAALRQKRALSRDLALRLGTHLRRLPDRTVPHIRLVAARAETLGAASRDAFRALGGHARDSARTAGAGIRRLTLQAPRLPRRTLTAAAALVVVAVAPLHDASRVELTAPAPVSSPAPSAVRGASAATATATGRHDAAPAQASPRAPAAPSPIRVQVNARPWARIRVDGVDAGPTPLSHLYLAAGLHDFEAEFPDGSVLHRRIQVGPERRFVSLP